MWGDQVGEPESETVNRPLRGDRTDRCSQGVQKPSQRPCSGDRQQRGQRAQTTLDFGIGASLFLVVVVFIVAFVPGMLGPFETTDPTQAADRFAASLSTDLLGHPAEGNRLDPTCTAAFFWQIETDQPTSDDCRFNETATTPAAMFATDQSVNVTIEERPQGGQPIERQYDGDDVTLAAGPSAEAAPSLTVSRRIVLLESPTSSEERTYRLIVRVW